MADRRKIGLIYNYDENWIGGTYYIQNLISALNLVTDDKKFHIIIFTSNPADFETLISKIKYPYISNRNYLKEFNLIERAVNKLNRNLFNRNYFDRFHKDIDIVFPGAHEDMFRKQQQFLYWIPDFQEHFLPEFFTKDEIKNRKNYQERIIENAKHILFSSESVQKDFNTLYPLNKLDQFVVRFAVTHDLSENSGTHNSKYQLPGKYFMCSNQFWKHKNHGIVLRAIHFLKNKGLEVFVVFTGKEHDYRNPEYYDDLKQQISDLEISDNVKFLGFIDRSEQLVLMKNSLAVIQPSKFEGWSTVIEDAKALSVTIIATGIEVHKEQLQSYPTYYLFDCENEEELGSVMNGILNTQLSKQDNVYDYPAQVNKFGYAFTNAINSLIDSRN